MVNTSGPGGGFRPERGSDAAPLSGSTPSWSEGAEEFLEEERLRSAVQARRRERWREQRRIEELGVHGALRGAVGAVVRLHLRDGAEVHGTLDVVGVDVVGVDSGPGRVWVALHAVGAAELPGPPVEREQARWEPTFAEVLEDLRGEGHPVTVTVQGGATLRGELVTVGASVVLRGGHGRHVVLDPSAIVSCG